MSTQDYPDITRAKVERVRDMMNTAIPDGIVTDYEDLIETLSLADPDDRHVLAAAIRANADIIVTINLKDFSANALAIHGIEAMHPDPFLMTLFDAAPARFARRSSGSARDCATRRRRPTSCSTRLKARGSSRPSRGSGHSLSCCEDRRLRTSVLSRRETERASLAHQAPLARS